MDLACFNWKATGIPLQEFVERRERQIQEENRMAIFNEMMAEGKSIRRTLVTNNRPSGWGRSQGKYRSPYKKDDLPKRRFADSPFIYKGKEISDEEAKKIFQEYNEKKDKTV